MFKKGADVTLRPTPFERGLLAFACLSLAGSAAVYSRRYFLPQRAPARVAAVTAAPFGDSPTVSAPSNAAEFNVARASMLFGEVEEVEEAHDSVDTLVPSPMAAPPMPIARGIAGPPWRVVLFNVGATEGRLAVAGDTVFGYTVVRVWRDSVTLGANGREITLGVEVRQ